MTDTDAELTAFIDGELDAAANSRLTARLAEDAALRARHEALRAARAPLDAAFAAALDMAPGARLRQIAAALGDVPAARPASARAVWRGVAAGFVAGVALTGAGWITLGRIAPPEREDWRSAVVEYMGLFTPDTFALAHPDERSESAQLQAVAAKLGVPLAPSDVAIAGLTFKSAQLLAYDGAPLGEIAYADERGEPALFCIIAHPGPDAPARTERRDGVTLASWSRAGRSYLVVGRASETRVVEMAETLARRF